MRPASPAKLWLRAQAAQSRRTTRPMVALGVLSVLCGIAQAWAVALLVGPPLLGHAPLAVAGPATLFAAAALLRAGVAVWADRAGFAAGAAARRRLRTAYLVSAIAAGPHALGDAGTAASTAIEVVDGTEAFFGRWLAASTLAWAGPLLVLLAVALADPAAAGILALCGLLVPFGMALAGIGAAAASHRQFAAMARLQSRFLDRVRGIATLVLSGQAAAEATRLRAAADELTGRTMRVLRVAFLSSAVLDAASVLALVLLAIRAGLAWRAGTLDGTQAVFGLVLVLEFFAPLRAYALAYQDRVHATTAAARLSALPPAAEAPSPPIRTVAAQGVTVAFESVRYTWDPARGPALDDLSFRIAPNETAVLVGPSGAGKSTAIELLLGFVRPERGRITINGADLATITPAALSRMTAWIGQQPLLFAGSVRDNVRFGRPDAAEHEIEDAVRAARLGAVAAALPQGLDTVLGEGGYGLSGGQAQRVAIARAFLRNAPLLLLDEPTAHLDPATEADVLDSLRRLALGRTVLIASHSSAAAAFGGRRIVLAQGRAVLAQGAA